MNSGHSMAIVTVSMASSFTANKQSPYRENAMYKLKTNRLFFALAIGLAVAVGCTDANASESTYMPLYEPCVHGEAPPPEHVLDEYDPAALERDLDPDTDERVEEEREAEQADDPFELFNERPFSQAAPYVGPTPEATPASTTGGQDSTDSNKVDINSADADELTELPGIGPALAERILEYRQSRDFENPAQLQRIEGIGPATLENIESLVRVE